MTLVPKRKQEIIGILAVVIAILTLGSLTTTSDADENYFLPGSTMSISEVRPDNGFGYAGMFFSHYAYYFFGMLSLCIPALLGLWGLRLLLKWDNMKYVKRLYYAAGVFLSVSVMTALGAVNPPIEHVDYVGTLGGLMTHLISSLLSRVFGSIGTTVICIAGILVFGSLLVDWRPRGWEKKVRSIPKWIFAKVSGFYRSITAVFESVEKKPRSKAKEQRKGRPLWKRILLLDFGFLEPAFKNREENKPDDDSSYAKSETPAPSAQFVTDYKKIEEDVVGKDDDGPDSKPDKPPRRKKVVLKRAQFEGESGEYEFPDLDVLEDNPQPIQSVSRTELQQTSDDLLKTLKTFGVQVEGDKIEKYPGPVITRFEFKPGLGVKVNQVVNLSDDLALALRAKRIRIIAPVPGKAAVGVEIPNRNPQTVYLKDIITTDDYNDGEVALPLAFGRTTAGEPFVADLAAMPHLLVAGATGSGKSVCLNVMVTSLVYRHSPRTLRFLFIDPKMLELSVYKGLPHLERPVVTSPKKAEKLLNDAVAEMENRYKTLASENVRNIADYNAKVEETRKLPYIVIMVDELADLMMSTASTHIETLITRLAQMARAVGIHLVLATQRPSVDVITGLIKANFPARVAFQVATRIDSRTILDGNGAEKLLGKGDMLFLQPGQPEAERIHGALVTSQETSRLMDHMKEQVVEIDKIDNFSPESSARREEDLGKDPLLKEAAELVVRHKQGSVSLLQRRLGIGYQRAARLIDQLEEKRIVGAYDGSKAREVLVDEAYLSRIMKN